MIIGWFITMVTKFYKFLHGSEKDHKHRTMIKGLLIKEKKLLNCRFGVFSLILWYELCPFLKTLL
jgi:hypothetical protein